MRFGNKELSKKFGRRAGVATLLASTAVGAAALGIGIGQASASPGIAPPPLAPGLEYDNILNRMDRFAHQFAQANYPDDTSLVRMSSLPTLSDDGSGSAVYKNLNNPNEQFSVYCPPSGKCLSP